MVENGIIMNYQTNKVIILGELEIILKPSPEILWRLQQKIRKKNETILILNHETKHSIICSNVVTKVQNKKV